MDEFLCPLPFGSPSHIVMGHGAGGRMTQTLIREIFLRALGNPNEEGHDSEVFSPESSRLAITTDGFVVRPLFFPGGDIGSLAVFGTINDLAMSGAVPRHLTASFILEEGLPLETLSKIVFSMKRALETTGARLIAGDTKVVEKGKGDGLYLSMSGVGEIHHSLKIAASSIQARDCILITGDVGRHGIAVMNAREKLFPETEILSDCAALSAPVQALIQAGVEVHCLRDLTRGGLATALVELAEASGYEFAIEEERIVVASQVRSACELLGLDPCYVANEGRFIAILPEQQAEQALWTLREFEVTRGATVIGRVQNRRTHSVVLKTAYGTERMLDRLSGDMLPRIC